MKKTLILSLALVGLTLAGCAAEETTPAEPTIDPAEVTTEPMIDDTTMMDDTMMDDATMGTEEEMMDEAPADTTM